MIIEEISFNQFRTPEKGNEVTVLKAEIAELKHKLAESDERATQNKDERCIECPKAADMIALLRDELANTRLQF